MGIKITLTCEICGKKKEREEKVRESVNLHLNSDVSNFYTYLFRKDFRKNIETLLCADCYGKIVDIKAKGDEEINQLKEKQ